MFSLHKSQFSVNSVFAVKVKIPFSQVLQISSNSSELLFFLEQAKYTAICTTMKLKTNYVLE